MSVLVKGWSIPTDGCCGCYFRTGKYCGILGRNERVLEYAERFTRPDNCPLVEVPTPHGKLVDADAFKKENERLLHCDFPYLSETTLEELIDAEATVIEAEV